MWFDGQAKQFDEWAGLDPAMGRAVVRAVLEQTGASADDLILDVGPGTGAIGLYFAAAACRYLGLDRSRHMLEVFRHKLTPCPGHLLLLVADGDRPWPIGDGSAAGVFASRVVHHLQARHFVQEVFRVCRRGGCLLLGRVSREADALPTRLQRQKRALLAEHGVRSRAGGQAVRQVIEACAARGATVLEPLSAARWTRTVSPRQVISAWDAKPQFESSAGGAGLTADARTAVVTTLTDWAVREFGGLDRPEQFVEEYTLERVRLP
jgi:ubiquinone/menaquinone biosynthesis C-methylase UbiE